MHHNLIIKDGDTTKVVKEVLVDGIQFFDEKPRAGSTNPVTSDGVFSGLAEVEEAALANIPIAEKTIRFSFGNLEYDPTKDTATSTAGGANAGKPSGKHDGTWKKLVTKYTNIWDYTITGTDLSHEWNNGNTASVGSRFWDDPKNNPISIIATNVSGITNFLRCFQGCYGLVYVCNNFDTSDATNVQLLFSSCHNLESVPDLDLQNCTTLAAVFQDCMKIRKCPKLQFPTAETGYSLQTFFKGCRNLQDNIKLDITGASDITAMFQSCTSLTNIELITSAALTKIEAAFCLCCSLKNKPVISNTENVANMKNLFRGEYSSASPYITDMQLESFPIYDFANVTDMGYYITYDSHLKHIPEFSAPNLQKCMNMFENCANVESGMLRAYTYLKNLGAQITDHTDCFLNCGIDTPTGRAELEQIPASWGGLAEG